MQEPDGARQKPQNQPRTCLECRRLKLKVGPPGGDPSCALSTSVPLETDRNPIRASAGVQCSRVFPWWVAVLCRW
jgi:hypothetical protein